MNNPLYLEMTPTEQSEFIGKVIIAVQSDFFSEGCELVNRAQKAGLFDKIKLSTASHPDIIDLDNPIHRTSEQY